MLLRTRIYGSIADLKVLNRDVTREEVDAAMKKASETNLKGILEYNEEEIVSSDIIGNAHSSKAPTPGSLW